MSVEFIIAIQLLFEVWDIFTERVTPCPWYFEAASMLISSG